MRHVSGDVTSLDFEAYGLRARSLFACDETARAVSAARRLLDNKLAQTFAIHWCVFIFVAKI